MFSKYNNLVKRVEALERASTRHAEFLHRDYEALKTHKKGLEEFEKTLGSEEPSVYDSYLLGALFGGLEEPRPKKLTLIKKVNAIMEHLGLVVVTTKAKTEIVKKPVGKVKKIATKKKGTK